MIESRSLLTGAMMVLLAAACSEGPTSPSEVVSPGKSVMEVPSAGPVFTVNPGSLEGGATPPGGVSTLNTGSATSMFGSDITYTDIKSGNFAFLAWSPANGSPIAAVLNGMPLPLTYEVPAPVDDESPVFPPTWTGTFSVPINGIPTDVPVRVSFLAPNFQPAANFDTLGVPSFLGAVAVIPGTSLTVHVNATAFFQGLWRSMDDTFGTISGIVGQPMNVSVMMSPGFAWKMNSCAAGNYMDVSAGSCQAAPAGSYSAGGYATSATQCATGTYQPDTGQSSCIDADAGYYVNQTGLTSQTACGNGRYQPDTGQYGCLSAPPGSYATGLAQTEVTQCSPGYYANGYGNTSCAAAPRGTYVAGSGAANPVACAAGTYNNSTGQTSCNAAPAGYYVPNTGAFVPTQCAAGSYTATSGSTSCTLAAPGSYVASAGARSSTQCAAGYYQPNSGASSCIAAAIGFYVPDAGASSQTACAAGYTTNAVASTSCVKMDPIVAYDALITAAQTTSGVAASEVNKLSTARKQLVSGKPAGACRAIDGFVSYVNKQTGKGITASNASILIRKAQDADVAIGC